MKFSSSSPLLFERGGEKEGESRKRRGRVFGVWDVARRRQWYVVGLTGEHKVEDLLEALRYPAYLPRLWSDDTLALLTFRGSPLDPHTPFSHYFPPAAFSTARQQDSHDQQNEKEQENKEKKKKREDEEWQEENDTTNLNHNHNKKELLSLEMKGRDYDDRFSHKRHKHQNHLANHK